MAEWRRQHYAAPGATCSPSWKTCKPGTLHSPIIPRQGTGRASSRICASLRRKGSGRRRVPPRKGRQRRDHRRRQESRDGLRVRRLRIYQLASFVCANNDFPFARHPPTHPTPPHTPALHPPTHQPMPLIYLQAFSLCQCPREEDRCEPLPVHPFTCPSQPVSIFTSPCAHKHVSFSRSVATSLFLGYMFGLVGAQVPGSCLPSSLSPFCRVSPWQLSQMRSHMYFQGRLRVRDSGRWHDVIHLFLP